MYTAIQTNVASRICLVTCSIFISTLVALAEPRSLLILHTNDLHDHVRADYDGSGGLAYVSGYIKNTKTSRNDVLVLDAGDMMEKGDLVAFKAKSTIMYQAISRIGYDAITPGNHDDTYGDEHLLYCASLANNTATLALNLLDKEGELLFAPSKIFERNGLKIGVIGVFKPRDENSLDMDGTIVAIAAEAKRLELLTHLIVVVAHLGPKECKTIAETATNVDIFVSGHTHQALQSPLTAKANSALIVQAGSYAEYVGRLELVIEDTTGEILNSSGSLIPMDHTLVPDDKELRGWFDEQERLLAPDAMTEITTIDQVLTYTNLAYLGAEGIRLSSGVDIGFCHMSQIIRANLPAGVVDVNAIFRTGGQRGSEIVGAELTGGEIEVYIEGLANSDWGKTHWSGFRGRYDGVGRQKTVKTDLDPERIYRIAMPRKEWDTRLRRLFQRHVDTGMAKRILSVQPETLETTFTRGVVEVIESSNSTPNTIANAIEIMAGLQ